MIIATNWLLHILKFLAWWFEIKNYAITYTYLAGLFNRIHIARMYGYFACFSRQTKLIREKKTLRLDCK